MSTPAPRILIADDNPEGLELMEAYLAGTPYDVRVAADGEETLKVVAEWKPDLLLLDVMMPKLSGFEVCKRLRQVAETKSVIVIMVTALDQAADIDRAVEAGAHDFITKPINKTELLRRIRAALESRKHADPVQQALAYIDAVQAN